MINNDATKNASTVPVFYYAKRKIGLHGIPKLILDILLPCPPSLLASQNPYAVSGNHVVNHVQKGPHSLA